MRLILNLAGTVLFVYFTTAIALIFLPFERNIPQRGLDFDAIDLRSPSYEIVAKTYIARDGAELFYRSLHGPSNVTVVLLHGSGSEGRYLLPLASRLNSGAGITVLVPDLRGHGRSKNGHPGDVSYIGQLEHDLEDLHRQLTLSSPTVKLMLGGHSSGGGLVVKYGGSNLQQFGGAILLAPYLGYQAPTVRPDSGGWVQVAKLRYAGLSMLNALGITLFNDLPVLFFNRPASANDSLQVDSYSYRMNESFSPQAYQSDLSHYDQPMMFVVGENDEAFYPEAFTQVVKESAPKAELDIVDNANHLGLVSDPRVAAIIERWLQAHTAQNTD